MGGYPRMRVYPPIRAIGPGFTVFSRAFGDKVRTFGVAKPTFEFSGFKQLYVGYKSRVKYGFYTLPVHGKLNAFSFSGGRARASAHVWPSF